MLLVWSTEQPENSHGLNITLFFACMSIIISWWKCAFWDLGFHFHLSFTIWHGCHATCSVAVGLEYVTEIQVIGQSPRYHCQLCDSKFDHNLKFPHLVGSKHRFNVLVSKMLLSVSHRSNVDFVHFIFTVIIWCNLHSKGGTALGKILYCDLSHSFVRKRKHSHSGSNCLMHESVAICGTFMRQTH